MDGQRRCLLRAGAGAGVLAALAAAGVSVPASAWAAWDARAFGATDVAAAFAALGAEERVADGAVQLIVADVAEDGAVVPVGVASSLRRTESIAILVAGNPNPLAAVFTLAAGTVAEVHTRVRMRATSAIHALVRADGRFHVASREVTVTFSGCQG